MSWDLYLVPPEHAVDAQEWSEEMLEGEPDVDAAQRQAHVIIRRRPDLEIAELPGGVQVLAPEASGLPVVADLSGHYATVNVSYWDPGERADELADLVVDIAEAMHEAAGFVAFDPQRDRVVSQDELRAAFLGGHRDGVAITKRLAEESGVRHSKVPARSRTWIRPRLGTALAIAAILLLIAHRAGLL